MHTAILNTDVDGVLFLIGIEVDTNSPIQDGTLRTPLHLSIPSGSEVIVRHLVSLFSSISFLHVELGFDLKSKHSCLKEYSLISHSCIL